MGVGQKVEQLWDKSMRPAKWPKENYRAKTLGQN